jgi:hypothetical protein
MELVNLLVVISWDSITEVHEEVNTGCPRMGGGKKNLYAENTYYTEEVISQFGSTNVEGVPRHLPNKFQCVHH